MLKMIPKLSFAQLHRLRKKTKIWWVKKRFRAILEGWLIVLKKKAWKQRYERLLNVELPWWEKDLSEADLVLGTTPVITQAMVEKSIVSMKKRQST